ncbi:MAG: F0F1 ATP synthase subunit epsilon [Holosporaceae bacterium]|nr:F0F1 ATP synthase subunit epsilon [Holosporaceae bacterium]
MQAKVLTLGKELFNGEAVKVVVPAVNGEMCLLPNHISIITALRRGYIRVFRPMAERPIPIAIERGVCSFSDNSAIFIVETAA